MSEAITIAVGSSVVTAFAAGAGGLAEGLAVACVGAAELASPDGGGGAEVRRAEATGGGIDARFVPGPRLCGSPAATGSSFAIGAGSVTNVDASECSGEGAVTGAGCGADGATLGDDARCDVGAFISLVGVRAGGALVSPVAARIGGGGGGTRGCIVGLR